MYGLQVSLAAAAYSYLLFCGEHVQTALVEGGSILPIQPVVTKQPFWLFFCFPAVGFSCWLPREGLRVPEKIEGSSSSPCCSLSGEELNNTWESDKKTHATGGKGEAHCVTIDSASLCNLLLFFFGGGRIVSCSMFESRHQAACTLAQFGTVREGRKGLESSSRQTRGRVP